MSVEDQQRLTSRIVAAFVRKNFVPTDQIGGLIGSVHSTLMGLGNPPVIEEPPRVPAVSVRRSVQADYIICIDCGYKGQMLKKHLQSRHGLSVDQYKRRWKLSSEYPTTAPNYSEYRSQLAKSLGLGRTTAPPPAASEKPARRRSASTTTGTRTSAKKATTKKASAKKSSAKKTSSRSRKPSSKVASKAATAPAGATA